MKSKFAYVNYIKTAPGKLWHELVTPESIKQWWGGGINMKSEWNVGSSWTMSYEEGRASEVGEVLESNPPKRLVIEWRNEFDPEMKAEGFSLCTLELKPMEDAVELMVTQVCWRRAVGDQGLKGSELRPRGNDLVPVERTDRISRGAKRWNLGRRSDATGRD